MQSQTATTTARDPRSAAIMHDTALIILDNIIVDLQRYETEKALVFAEVLERKYLGGPQTDSTTEYYAI